MFHTEYPRSIGLHTEKLKNTRKIREIFSFHRKLLENFGNCQKSHILMVLANLEKFGEVFEKLRKIIKMFSKNFKCYTNIRKIFGSLSNCSERFLYEFGKCQKRSCRFKFLFKRFWNIRRSAGDDSNTEKQLNTTKLRPLLLIGCIFHVRTTLLLRLLKLTNTCRGVTYVNIVLILFCFVLFCFVL